MSSRTNTNSASIKLLEEVEAEGSCDVKEVGRNPGLLVQPCGENSLEEVQSVQGTRLVEID